MPEVPAEGPGRKCCVEVLGDVADGQAAAVNTVKVAVTWTKGLVYSHKNILGKSSFNFPWQIPGGVQNFFTPIPFLDFSEVIR